MRNVEIERLEAKLKLWDTPGFSQFLDDMENAVDNPISIEGLAGMMKIVYQHKLAKLKEEAEGKFKQGKLGL